MITEKNFLLLEQGIKERCPFVTRLIRLREQDADIYHRFNVNMKDTNGYDICCEVFTDKNTLTIMVSTEEHEKKDYYWEDFKKLCEGYYTKHGGKLV